MKATVDLLAGRYDRRAALLAGQVETSLNAGVDALVLTEVDRPARGDVLERIAKADDLHLIRGSDGWRGETALLVRRDRWQLDSRRLWVLDHDLPGMRLGCIAPAAALIHRATDTPWVLTGTHLPSGVQDAYDRPGTTPAEAAHAQAARRWCDRLDRATVPVGAFSDWNLNLHNHESREHLEKALDGRLDLPPDRLLPKGGDHAGGRLISFPATRGVTVDGIELLPRHPASDHAGVRTHLTITTPWRKP